MRKDDPKLIDKLTSQPFMNDGAVKLWIYHAGLDATKECPKHVSMYRMKANADEQYLKQVFEIVTRSMTEGDVGMFFSGRNSLIYRDIRKEALATKPRMGIRELAMEPDEEQLLKLIRPESNRCGSIDCREHYLLLGKTAGPSPRSRASPDALSQGTPHSNA